MSNTKHDRSENPLEPIKGKQLSAVCFVQDYVQLQFDGPGLTAVTLPTVTIGKETYEFGMLNYRNVLCERIAKIVREASVAEGEQIRIEFEDRSSISVSLKPPENPRISEMAIFDNGPSDFWVWNT